MPLLNLLLAVLVQTATSSPSCSSKPLDEPLAFQDGTFIIAGVFNIGTLTRRVEENGNKTVEECSYVNASIYNLQRALALKKTVIGEQDRFKALGLNITLGYAIYDACRSPAVTGRVSSKIATNERVIGVAGIDHGKLVKISAYYTTAFDIPTFTYIYNDEDLMDADKYPTLFSMIETEQTEAHILASFLEKMGFTYMDIWYHSLSEDMAGHLYDEYVIDVDKANGCARKEQIDEINKTKLNIMETYNKTGGSHSQVQIILQNSRKNTEEILRYYTNQGYDNMIYVLGISNGRRRYRNAYSAILRKAKRHNDTLIYPLPFLLNTALPILDSKLQKLWLDDNDEADRLYKEKQNSECKAPQACDLTSWNAYVVAGVKVILEAVHENIMEIHNKTGKFEVPACIRDFRKAVYNKIVDEERETELVLDEGVELHAHFHEKSIHLGYTIAVYQSKTGEFNTLGDAFHESITITNTTLLESISHYKQHCSEACHPGTYRLYDETVVYLPCCWTCTDCSNNTYTDIMNANSCTRCNASAVTDKGRTGCFLIKYIYIKSQSYIFITAALLVAVCVILVFVTCGLIWKTEDRPIIKASDPGYLYTVLLSLAIGFIASLMPLIKPSQSSCTGEYICFVVFATATTSNLAWKCGKIYGIFAAANNFKRPKFEGLLKRAGQTWINIGSLSFVFLLVGIDGLVDANGWAFVKIQLQDHGPIYLQCQLGNSIPLVSLPLVLPVIYFVTALTLAFKMRHFPHNFRETLNIFGATLIVLLCCIMFLSGYSLSPPEIKPLLRTIVIFVASLSFLLCLFLPKIMILMKKDVTAEEEKAELKQSLHAFSNKTSSSSKKPSTVTPCVVGQKWKSMSGSKKLDVEKASDIKEAHVA